MQISRTISFHPEETRSAVCCEALGRPLPARMSIGSAASHTASMRINAATRAARLRTMRPNPVKPGPQELPLHRFGRRRRTGRGDLQPGGDGHSMGWTLKAICARCSGASPITRSTASTSCCRGISLDVTTTNDTQPEHDDQGKADQDTTRDPLAAEALPAFLYRILNSGPGGPPCPRTHMRSDCWQCRRYNALSRSIPSTV
jgi:hypothetical protein